MTTTLKAQLKKLSAERQKKITKHAKVLIEQEITLQDLVSPPPLGNPEAGFPILEDAPGSYVPQE